MSELPGSAFDDALDRLIGRWPEGTRRLRLSTSGGTAHVLASGTLGDPVVLLPGGGATGASWWNVAGSTAGRRLFALDIPGDAGGSTLDGGAAQDVTVLHAWLDDVVTLLGLDVLDLAGHSYGGWLALSYALARPGRVRRLSLVCPSMCFTSLSARYLLHALPTLLRPSARGARRLIAWETTGCPCAPETVDVYAAGADRTWPGIPRPTRPRADQLDSLAVGHVDLVLAARDRSHDNARCEAVARRHLRDLTVTTLADASHHSALDRGAGPIAAALAGTGTY